MYRTVGHQTSVRKGTTKRKNRKVGPSTKNESEKIQLTEMYNIPITFKRRNRRYRHLPLIFLSFLAELDIFESFETNPIFYFKNNTITFALETCDFLVEY